MMKVKNILIAMCALLFSSLLFAGSVAAIASADDGPNPMAKGVVPPSPSASCSGYSKVNVGGEISAGAYKVRLSDLSVNVGANNAHPAIIDVLDQNDAVLESIQVMPGATYTYSGQSGKIAISVCQTAPGFTLNAKWAKMKATPTTGAATNACQGYSTLNVGNSMVFGNLGVALDDIAIATGAANDHPAIVTAQDANGATVEKFQIVPGTSKIVQISTGKRYEISVCQTAPGFTLNAKWAKIKITQTTALPIVECPMNGFQAQSYGTVDIGGSIVIQGPQGGYSAVLTDISSANGAGNDHPAVIDIADPTGTIVDSAIVAAGSTYTYRAPNGQKVNVQVCQTAPGFTLNAKWAKLAMNAQ